MAIPAPKLNTFFTGIINVLPILIIKVAVKNVSLWRKVAVKSVSLRQKVAVKSVFV
jgi:hypothetical protein